MGRRATARAAFQQCARRFRGPKQMPGACDLPIRGFFSCEGGPLNGVAVRLMAVFLKTLDAMSFSPFNHAISETCARETGGGGDEWRGPLEAVG